MTSYTRKKSSVKTDLYLRFLGKRLKEAVSFHSILSLRFLLNLVLFQGEGAAKRKVHTPLLST